jgi:hypothetical protein
MQAAESVTPPPPACTRMGGSSALLQIMPSRAIHQGLYFRLKNPIFTFRHICM